MHGHLLSRSGSHENHVLRRGGRLCWRSLDGFLGLVEMDAIELHPWNSTVDDLEHPDRIIIDLDPGEGVLWEFVSETANE